MYYFCKKHIEQAKYVVQILEDFSPLDSLNCVSPYQNSGYVPKCKEIA